MDLSAQDLERLAARLDTLTPTQVSQVRESLVSETLRRCAEDGLFWLRYVSTLDEADPDAPVKPFPIDKDYVRLLWQVLATENRVVVAKSRQMIVSWLIAAFCVWYARFKPHQAVYWQTQDWADAASKVCQAEGSAAGRCQFIETHLPEWMRLEAKWQDGCMTYSNGSFIQAVAGGADKIRGKVGSLIVEDEFAKQQEARGVWATIAPIAHEKVKIFVIGTPNGSDNQFATLWHGRDLALGSEIR